MEIDEDAYPLLMAWEAGLAGNVSFYQDHIRPDADFIVDHGPAYGAERWEEHPGFSPADIAAEIAGLVAAAHLAQAAGDPARARLYLATADYYQRNVERWTVTTTGPYASRYFIRLSPTGNPNVTQTYDLGNGSLSNVDQRDVIDASFLELTRLGELPADDPTVKDSLKVVDSVLESQTASGPGWHRYGVKAGQLGQPAGSTDGYGDCYVPDPTSCSPTGAPWFPTGTGSGHPWPLLSGERAEQDLQAGDVSGAASLAATMQLMSSGLGLVPEQAWEDADTPASPYGSDPKTASIGFTNGKAAGSADPLIWAQAQYLRLVLDVHAGHLLDPASHYPGPLRHQRPSGDRAADHQRHRTRRGGDPAQHVDGGPGNHRGHPGQPGARPDHPAGPGHGQREDGPGCHRRHRGQPARHQGQRDGDRPDRGRLRRQLPRSRPDPARPEHPHRVRYRRRPRDRLGAADRDRQLGACDQRSPACARPAPACASSS